MEKDQSKHLLPGWSYDEVLQNLKKDLDSLTNNLPPDATFDLMEKEVMGVRQRVGEQIIEYLLKQDAAREAREKKMQGKGLRRKSGKPRAKKSKSDKSAGRSTV